MNVLFPLALYVTRSLHGPGAEERTECTSDFGEAIRGRLSTGSEEFG